MRCIAWIARSSQKYLHSLLETLANEQFGSPSPFFLAGKKAYEVERSLRFNDDDSAYLHRTPSSAGNRKIWTFSVG